MTEQVLIKKIGFAEIWLNDSNTNEFSLKRTLIITSIIAILYILIGYLIAITNKQSDIFANSLILGSLSFSIIILSFIICGVFYITIPAYRISTNADVDSIYIKKTTEEADQIAICKAATEIENQIKARAENLENLEKLKQIAERCK